MGDSGVHYAGVPPRSLGSVHLPTVHSTERPPCSCLKAYTENEGHSFVDIDLTRTKCPWKYSPSFQNDEHTYTCPITATSDSTNQLRHGFNLRTSYLGSNYSFASSHKKKAVSHRRLQSATQQYRLVDWSLTPAVEELEKRCINSLSINAIDQFRHNYYLANPGLQRFKHDNTILLVALFDHGQRHPVTQERLREWAQSAFSLYIEKEAIDCFRDGLSLVSLLNAIAVLAVLHRCRHSPKIDSPKSLTSIDIENLVAGRLQIQNVNFDHVVHAFWDQATDMYGNLNWKDSSLLGRVIQITKPAAPSGKIPGLYSQRLKSGDSHSSAILKCKRVEHRTFRVSPQEAIHPLLTAPRMERSVAHAPFMERRK